MEINLPSEVSAAEGQVAKDGTLVYRATDGGADAAVQALADGSVRMQTVTGDASGPHEFTYTFGDDVTPVQAEDGTVELVRQVDSGVAVGVATVDEPWAVDARGEAVKTTYEVVGDALVQKVVPDSDTAYPIVADPQVRLGLGGTYISVYFSKNETATMAASAAAALTVVNKVPNAIARTAIQALLATLSGVAGTATAQGKCVKVVVVVALVPGANFPQVYSGGLCK